ncbi:MAG: S-layer homology domain-containing protein [Oscillospiraceae bacterium]|jgi:hypothetical protein|nr:S-layer homology domain-containing protein [Oscillospiraceae bacterium]
MLFSIQVFPTIAADVETPPTDAGTHYLLTGNTYGTYKPPIDDGSGALLDSPKKIGTSFFVGDAVAAVYSATPSWNANYPYVGITNTFGGYTSSYALEVDPDIGLFEGQIQSENLTTDNRYTIPIRYNSIRNDLLMSGVGLGQVEPLYDQNTAGGYVAAGEPASSEHGYNAGATPPPKNNPANPDQPYGFYGDANILPLPQLWLDSATSAMKSSAANRRDYLDVKMAAHASDDVIAWNGTAVTGAVPWKLFGFTASSLVSGASASNMTAGGANLNLLDGLYLFNNATSHPIPTSSVSVFSFNAKSMLPKHSTTNGRSLNDAVIGENVMVLGILPVFVPGFNQLMQKCFSNLPFTAQMGAQIQFKYFNRAGAEISNPTGTAATAIDTSKYTMNAADRAADAVKSIDVAADIFDGSESTPYDESKTQIGGQVHLTFEVTRPYLKFSDADSGTASNPITWNPGTNVQALAGLATNDALTNGVVAVIDLGVRRAAGADGTAQKIDVVSDNLIIYAREKTATPTAWASAAQYHANSAADLAALDAWVAALSSNAEFELLYTYYANDGETAYYNDGNTGKITPTITSGLPTAIADAAGAYAIPWLRTFVRGSQVYTLTYHPNNPSDAMTASVIPAPNPIYDIANNGSATLNKPSKAPARVGGTYVFKGWSLTANPQLDAAVDYIGSETITEITANIDLYAVWVWVESPDIPEPPAVFTDDHYAYIIGYPIDYRTGEKTADKSLWPVKPQGTITRAEVTTVYFRLLTDATRSANWRETNDFSDVQSDDWFNHAVSTMSAMGIVNGYPDGTFKPNAPIERGEVAAIAARFARQMGTVVTNRTSFTDTLGHWAASDIDYAASVGWLNGYPDGTFKPNGNLTRAEFMALVNRMLERAPEVAHDDLGAWMEVWPDNADPRAWYYLDVQEATNSHTYHRKQKQVPNLNFNYEKWDSDLPERDWAELEN